MCGLFMSNGEDNENSDEIQISSTVYKNSRPHLRPCSIFSAGPFSWSFEMSFQMSFKMCT